MVKRIGEMIYVGLCYPKALYSVWLFFYVQGSLKLPFRGGVAMGGSLFHEPRLMLGSVREMHASSYLRNSNPRFCPQALKLNCFAVLPEPWRPRHGRGSA